MTAKAVINSLLLVLLLPLIYTGLASTKASAASAPNSTKASPSGVTISPAYQEVSVSQTESVHPLHFSLTNDKPSSQTFKITTSDFNALSETGGLFFVGANPTDLQKKYGLAKWLSLPYSSITLAPHQTAIIDAQVLNLPSLSPGGHYGSINIATDVNDNNSNGKIAIHPVASTLFFVTKLGGDTYKLKLANVNYKHSLFKLPSQIVLNFNNYGNTHLIPRGVATITDSNNRIVSRGIINNDSDLILPESYRQYNVAFKSLAKPKLYGKYTLSINYRFDGYDGYRTYVASLSQYGPLVVMLVLILIVLATLIVKNFGFVKRHISQLFSRVSH